jgi:plastocyanin
VREKWSLVAIASVVTLSTAGLAADALFVSQHGRKFTPDMLRIVPGATVRIANDDRVTHHVYIDQPEMKFDSGEQSVGNEVAILFDKQGRFAVRCAIHPTMHLDVTVAAPE